MQGIALIVFIASISSAHFKNSRLGIYCTCSTIEAGNSQRSKQLFIFSFVDWVGRWSILDLFVISIMVAVFDKGHLLSVYPGVAATSFTIVVIATLFAANSFDTRLIWDAQQTNNKTQHQDRQHND